MKCPRRHAGSIPNLPDEDEWHDRDEINTCSYCGSLDPEKFFELVADGADVGPTDKNYKAYVKHPSLRFGKFYFMHMSEEQMQKFIDLINAKEMKIGMPGHFYTRPYFVTKSTTIKEMAESIKDK